MTDRYVEFRELLIEWQQKNYSDFDAVESFFRSQIMTDERPDRLRLQVEMHRLLKLIKSDLEMLKASRSELKSQVCLQKIQARSESLMEICQVCIER